MIYSEMKNSGPPEDAMATIPVNLKSDHLERIIRSTSPVKAFCELIWNAFDADASQIRVDFIRTPLGGIESIQISDDGSGITFKEAKDFFGGLGGSWKQQVILTRKKRRAMHGKNGEGRFDSFALGYNLTWQSTYTEGSKTYRFKITGNGKGLDAFTIDDKPTEIEADKTGVTVTIKALSEKGEKSASETIKMAITREVAQYLIRYPGLELYFDGDKIDPERVIDRKKDYILDPIRLENKTLENVKLSIIEWKYPEERKLVFCDDNGFALQEKEINFQTPGFKFTSYLCAPEFVEMHKNGSLQFEGLDKDVKTIQEVAKKQIKGYFRRRKSEQASTIVDKWKDQGIYPYSDEARTPLEEAEREVFNFVSSSIHDYLPGFDKSPINSKKFQLTLLKQTLEKSPDSLIRVVEEVLGLPEDRKKDLIELLEHTSLSNIITASKLIGDRLKFLTGLEHILFDPISKKTLKERKELHRILVDQTWIFGEQYNLTVDDQSLTEVLRQHIKLLGSSRTDLVGQEADYVDETIEREVTTVDGSRGIVDLMLSRTLKSQDSRYEHLIIELKRPSQKIDSDVLMQGYKYAAAIADDSRFANTSTNWTIWLVSNQIAKEALPALKQNNREPGVYMETENIKVIAKTWSQIIRDAKDRLSFLKEKLEYEPSKDDAMAFMKKRYREYLGSYIEAEEAQVLPNGSSHTEVPLPNSIEPTQIESDGIIPDQSN